MGLRILLFGLVSLVGLLGLYRFRGHAAIPQDPSPPSRRSAWLGLTGLLILASAFLFPYLHRYPLTAPDELHHLVVARNLGVYGLYASGQPAEGFKLFDDYDSVGAPVLMPIAAAFRLGGVSLSTARTVIALFFLLLLMGLFLLLRPVYGAPAALMGGLGCLSAFSTIYLGRTLYGEVPALAYFVFGLIAWRRAILGAHPWRWGLLAGLLFAAAVLAKTILILSAFAFLTTWIYDQFNHRRLRWPHLFSVALGGVLLMGIWWIYQHGAQGNVSGNAASTLGIYQHYLLFGVGAVAGNLRSSLLAYPLTHLALLLALIWILPQIFAKRYDPAILVLFLTACFFRVLVDLLYARSTAALPLVQLCRFWRTERPLSLAQPAWAESVGRAPTPLAGRPAVLRDPPGALDPGPGQRGLWQPRDDGAAQPRGMGCAPAAKLPHRDNRADGARRDEFPA